MIPSPSEVSEPLRFTFQDQALVSMVAAYFGLFRMHLVGTAGISSWKPATGNEHPCAQLNRYRALRDFGVHLAAFVLIRSVFSHLFNLMLP